MSIEQKMCEVKIFQLQAMSNAITCIDKRFVVDWPEIQLEQSNNDNPTPTKLDEGCEM